MSAAFGRAEVVLSGERWTVAVADTADLRRRGLRGVGDLGEGLDGMLFVFEASGSPAFTMRGTEMSIDIAFFDSSGALVDVLEMVPCRADPCPSYRAADPFRYTVETEAGGFDGLGELRLDVASLPDGTR